MLRKEAKKEQNGKWIYKKWCCFECSNCGFKIDQYKMHLPPDLYPYCPMCGQKNIVKLTFSGGNEKMDKWSIDDLEAMYLTEYDEDSIDSDEDTVDEVLNFLNWCRKNLSQLN